MRVLMVSKACIVGIYQRKLELIAQESDIELKVLVPPFWKDERGVTPLERVYTQGYDLSVTPMRFNGNFHLHYYPEFSQTVQTFQPQIVHIDEEPYNLATWLALRAARKIGAKTLFFSWQNIARTYPIPFRWIENTVLRHIDYALVGTPSAAEVWQSKGYRGKTEVIPQFGVDAKLFTPPTERDPQRPLQIGFAGRLVEEKGVDLLLHALEPLREHAWDLQIIGGGPEKHHLERLAKQLGLGERIHFNGLVPSVEMPAIYRNLDVLVVPSRTRPNWKEQYGRVILEAMASGVAVIGSDSAAIPEVIGDAGIVFREDHCAELTQALARLLLNPNERTLLGVQGRQRVLEQFTQEQIARQTVRVYRELLSV